MLGKDPESLGKARWRSAQIAEDSKLNNNVVEKHSIQDGPYQCSQSRLKVRLGKPLYFRGCSQVWAPCLDLPNQMTRGRFPHSSFLSSLSDTLWMYFCIGWGVCLQNDGLKIWRDSLIFRKLRSDHQDGENPDQIPWFVFLLLYEMPAISPKYTYTEAL